jgi:hypothetical protein
VLIAGAATIIVIIGIVVAVAFFTHGFLHPASTPILQYIVNGNITVNASSYVSYNFTVPSTATVDGFFTVSGDINSTIKVYVMDGANLAGWQKGQTASMYYDSGAVNAANVTATLPQSGTYYLVYDNTFSSAAKNVTTQIDCYYLPAD